MNWKQIAIEVLRFLAAILAGIGGGAATSV